MITARDQGLSEKIMYYEKIKNMQESGFMPASSGQSQFSIRSLRISSKALPFVRTYVKIDIIMEIL